ncbi:MAG TPA: glycosyltransferase, partial [Sphingomicrobium sp.]|nr:glycosyltransferase [Sphingomicrobium sp.]
MSDLVDVTLHVDAIDTQLGGIGRYAWELAQRLPGQPGISSVQYVVRNRLIDDPERLLRGEIFFPGRGLVRAHRTWRARRALRSTIVHGPNYFLPPGTRTGVITVHDLSVFRFPETHPAARVRQFERSFSASLDRAAHVITDTETVRSELMEMFAVPKEKVTAVALGVSEHFRPIPCAELAESLRSLSLGAGRYALSISTLEP